MQYMQFMVSILVLLGQAFWGDKAWHGRSCQGIWWCCKTLSAVSCKGDLSASVEFPHAGKTCLLHMLCVTLLYSGRMAYCVEKTHQNKGGDNQAELHPSPVKEVSYSMRHVD